MTVGPIWNTCGTETEIIVPVSVLGPQRAGTEIGGDPLLFLSFDINHNYFYFFRQNKSVSDLNQNYVK